MTAELLLTFDLHSPDHRHDIRCWRIPAVPICSRHVSSNRQSDPRVPQNIARARRKTDRPQTGRRVLPRELADLGAVDQLLRGLRGLTRDGRLVRLGYYVHGRAFASLRRHSRRHCLR
jgi:hypothetical protein